VDETADQTPPEVTIEPADNGFIVRHHQRSGKKDQPGRMIRRLAMTDDEALGHAKTALNGGGPARTAKKKSASRSVGHVADDAGEEGSTPAPAAHQSSSHSRARTPRRRPVRSRRRV